MQELPIIKAGSLFRKPLVYVTVPALSITAGFALIWCGAERKDPKPGRNISTSDYPLIAKPLVPVRTTYPASLIQVLDGETFEAYVDLGFGVRVKQRFTLDGIKVQAKGKGAGAAKEHLTSLLKDQQLVLELSKVRDGNYVRVFLEEGNSGKLSEDVGSKMIKNGFAKTETRKR